MIKLLRELLFLIYHHTLLIECDNSDAYCIGKVSYTFIDNETVDTIIQCFYSLLHPDEPYTGKVNVYLKFNSTCKVKFKSKFSNLEDGHIIYEKIKLALATLYKRE